MVVFHPRHSCPCRVRTQDYCARQPLPTALWTCSSTRICRCSMARLDAHIVLLLVRSSLVTSGAHEASAETLLLQARRTTAWASPLTAPHSHSAKRLTGQVLLSGTRSRGQTHRGSGGTSSTSQVTGTRGPILC